MNDNNFLRTGTLLKDDSYRIETVLGSGGFGVTYRAVQVLLGKTVAIKEFYMGDYCVRDIDSLGVTVAVEKNVPLVERFKKKFIREARMVAQLTNRHIIDIYDVFEENKTAYYVMEYLPGGCVEDYVSANGAIPEKEALEFIKQIGSAVSYIHENKILHLDIKPANIMLRGEGDAVLIDFGISKQYSDDGSKKSSVAAAFSRTYAPLEQFEAIGVEEFSPAVDVYSFAATAYFMISGQQPPNSLSLLKEELKQVPNASNKVSAAIISGMQPLQALRLKSIAEFLEMLGDAPSQSAVVAVDYKRPATGGSNEINTAPGGEGKIAADAGKNCNSGGMKAWVVVAIVLLVVTLLAVVGYLTFSYFTAPKSQSKKNRRTSVTLVDETYAEDLDEIEQNSQAEETGGARVNENGRPIEEFSENDGSQPSPVVETPAAPARNDSPRDYAAASAEGVALVQRGNYAAALPLLRQAAEHNISQAQNALGECYQRGYGVSIDYSQALSWYSRAANNGNADAQYNLAVCYSRGLGIGKNPATAATFFEKAARQGHLMAQYNLAECYRNGTGVRIDYSTAAYWYREAAAQGYAPARDRLSALERN